jgi:outer membrane protein
MQRTLAWTVVMVCTFLAQGALTAQKIGYVSTEAIRDKFEPGKAAEARLQSAVDEWKAELATRQKDIDELEVEYKKNRLIWTDQERQQKEKEIEEKRRDRDRFAKDKFEPGGEHDKLAKDLLGAVWQKIYTAVQKVAAAEGYDMVWDKATQPLVYVNAKFDLTVKVMKELGIDAGDMEKKQKDAIENDPRNKRANEPRRRKSRGKADEPPADTPPEGEFPSDPNRQPPANSQLPQLVPLGPTTTDTSKTKRSDEVPR